MVQNPGATTMAASFAGQVLQKEASKNSSKQMGTTDKSTSMVEQRADLKNDALDKGHVTESSLPPTASGKVDIRA